MSVPFTVFFFLKKVTFKKVIYKEIIEGVGVEGWQWELHSGISIKILGFKFPFSGKFFMETRTRTKFPRGQFRDSNRVYTPCSAFVPVLLFFWWMSYIKMALNFVNCYYAAIFLNPKISILNLLAPDFSDCDFGLILKLFVLVPLIIYFLIWTSK